MTVYITLKSIFKTTLHFFQKIMVDGFGIEEIINVAPKRLELPINALSSV
jgi:hypothetical protein